MGAREDLAVFANLSDDQIRAVAEMFDESILEKYLPSDKIRGAGGADLTDAKIKSITRVFYNFFYDVANESENVAHAINNSDLNREKRSVLLDTLEKIRNGVDKNKIRQYAQRNMLKTFGHPRLGQLGIMTEFRPISDGDKITKFVPLLVIDGLLYDRDVQSKHITVQFDLAGAKNLVEQLKSSIDTLEMETKDIQNKFGGDIVD